MDRSPLERGTTFDFNENLAALAFFRDQPDALQLAPAGDISRFLDSVIKGLTPWAPQTVEYERPIQTDDSFEEVRNIVEKGNDAVRRRPGNAYSVWNSTFPGLHQWLKSTEEAESQPVTPAVRTHDLAETSTGVLKNPAPSTGKRVQLTEPDYEAADAAGGSGYKTWSQLQRWEKEEAKRDLVASGDIDVAGSPTSSDTKEWYDTRLHYDTKDPHDLSDPSDEPYQPEDEHLSDSDLAD